MPTNKKYLHIFLIALACIFLFYYMVSDRKSSSVTLSNLCGTWKTQLLMNVNKVAENSDSDTTYTVFINFDEEQEGLWSVSFADNHPISSRSFSYSTDENKLVMVFENNKIEEYIFSINAGILTLDGKFYSGDFVRVN